MHNYKKEFKGSFEKAEAKTREELQKQGFGVLTEIDVKATIKKKLGKKFEDYKILGACNPPFAFEALEAEKEIGLMLPCNVIIFVDNGKIFISTILPTKAMQMINNEKLENIAMQIEEKLKRVVDEATK